MTQEVKGSNKVRDPIGLYVTPTFMTTRAVNGLGPMDLVQKLLT